MTDSSELDSLILNLKPDSKSTQKVDIIKVLEINCYDENWRSHKKIRKSQKITIFGLKTAITQKRLEISFFEPILCPLGC